MVRFLELETETKCKRIKTDEQAAFSVKPKFPRKWKSLVNDEGDYQFRGNKLRTVCRITII